MARKMAYILAALLLLCPSRGLSLTTNDMKYYQITCQSIDKKEYASYYRVVREKIKGSLSKNYKYNYKEGDVNIFFMLRSDGSLLRLDVDSADSTKEKELIEVATSSVRQASPFPRFPKNITASQISFNIKISFKES